MRICFNDMLYAFSYALDSVEQELLGVATYHSERVAYICVQMGKQLGLSDNELSDLAAYAVLHDNALVEYIRQEHKGGTASSNERELKDHCKQGEENVSRLPFFGDIKNVILYHHENADGSGLYGKKAEEIPVYSSLIHLADMLDRAFDLSNINENKYNQIVNYLNANSGRLFLKKHCDLFVEIFDCDTLAELEGENVEVLLRQSMQHYLNDYTPKEIAGFSEIFANIIDYKSEFTSRHSIGVAQKAMTMTKWYGDNEETAAAMYLAGALHDIGKLIIDNDILEKPDKLTDKEFTQMKNHAYWTYKVLSKISGFEELTRWSALHHEKLDGSGYPFGYTAEKLNFKERLMACIDIYQALTEKRPYKDGLSHEKTISIMIGMAEKGEIDMEIVEDLDKVYGRRE